MSKRQFIFFISLFLFLVEPGIEYYWLTLKVPVDFTLWRKVMFVVFFVLCQVAVITSFYLLLNKKTFAGLTKRRKIIYLCGALLLKIFYIITLYTWFFGFIFNRGIAFPTTEPVRKYVYSEYGIHIYIYRNAANWKPIKGDHPLLDMLTFTRRGFHPLSSETSITYASTFWPKEHELGSLISDGYQEQLVLNGDPVRRGDSLFFEIVEPNVADTSIFAVDLAKRHGSWIKVSAHGIAK